MSTTERFHFFHTLIKKDRLLLEIGSEQAELIANEAYKAYKEAPVLLPRDWVEDFYPAWIKNFVYISEHMPEHCKELLTAERKSNNVNFEIWTHVKLNRN